MTNTDNILTSAMLVGLSISSCDFKKVDRKASKEAADAHGISERKLRATKELLPEFAPEFVALKKSINALRNEHYRQSLPWSDSGMRVIKSEQYFPYMNVMQTRMNEVETALKNFKEVYPALIKESGLNDLHNDSDYPRVEELDARFQCGISIYPLPAGSDFRCDLAGSTTEGIQAEIDRNREAAVSQAMKKVYETIHDSVKRVVDKLSDTEATFRDSLIDNLRELTDEWLPAFNLTNDAGVTAIGEQIKAQLLADPDALRKDPSYRKVVADRASDIMRQMAGLY